MGTYGGYVTDKNLEKNGVLLDLGEAGTFIVARTGGANNKYLETVRKSTMRYRRQINAGTLDAAIADRLTIDAFAKTIVLGWLKKGDQGCEHDVTGKDGSVLPFTVENAKMLLTDLNDLFLDIKDCADSATAYREEVVAEEGKSSVSSSDTP